MPIPLETFDARAFRFACAIVRLDLAIYRLPRVPLHISRHILASGTSIGANLEEAKASQSRRDITATFSIALKEARETAYWLRLLVATDLVDEPSMATLMRGAQELVSILTVARRRLAMTSSGSSDPRPSRSE
jgi:four helix bundle protein